MKLLLDECLPVNLRHSLPEHHVVTVRYRGWKNIKNGKLLSLAASEQFDALLTTDLGMAHSQNPGTLPLAVLLIHAPQRHWRY